MDAFWPFLLDILLLLAAATVLGTIAERLRQSAMVGYLLAGVLLGPGTFRLLGLEPVIDPNQINAIAQLGVALLMFSIGLEFNFTRLRSLGGRTLLAGGLQIGGTLLVSGLVAWLFGVRPAGAIAVGCIVAMSSTGVVLPLLAARGEVDSVHGRFALGILLMQDLAVVPAVLLVGAMREGSGIGGILLGTGKSFLIAGLFVGGYYLVSRFVLPKLIAFGTRAGNREMPTLFGIVAAAGSTWLANDLGLSAALGAFIAGMFLGESVMATQFRGDIAPIKTVFVTLFFVSIGIVAEPGWVMGNLLLVGVALSLVLLIKPAVVLTVARSMGLTWRHAVAAGVTLGQIGVFSIVLANAAYNGGAEDRLIEKDTFDLMLAVTIITLMLTPYLVRLAKPTGDHVQAIMTRAGLARVAEPPAIASADAIDGHVVVVGYGPAGQEVGQALTQKGHPIVVIDLNPRTIIRARAKGLQAYVGDAAAPETLELASVRQADAVVVAVPFHEAALSTIERVRSMAPNTRIIARARYVRYVEQLRKAGAHVVIDDEEQVGQALGTSVVDLIADQHKRSHKPA